MSAGELEHFLRSREELSDGARLLESIRAEFPAATTDEVASALATVARGEPCAAGPAAAAALCELAGLGDPLATADAIYNKSGEDPTEPQWFLWIAGYSYNWICNAGLSAVYFDFGDRQFADRIRVYEAIGAAEAVAVLRDADAAFGPDGPPATLEERQALLSDSLSARLAELGPRFWGLEHEIFTRAYLYALAHPRDFRAGGQMG